MALIAKRDHDALAALMSRHQRGLLNLFYRYTNDRFLAEDLAQEVFVRVYKSAPYYQSRSLFQVWLYRIAKNLCLNELKSSRMGQVLFEEEKVVESPDCRLLRAEKEARIRQEIKKLPERQRLALILRKYHGLSQEETAQVMETTTEAVESLMSRARTRLRASLSDLLP